MNISDSVLIIKSKFAEKLEHATVNNCSVLFETTKTANAMEYVYDSLFVNTIFHINITVNLSMLKNCRFSFINKFYYSNL